MRAATMLLSVLVCVTGFAQDKLTLKDGTVYEGRVVTQTKEIVFFKWVDSLGMKQSKIFKVEEIKTLERGGAGKGPKPGPGPSSAGPTSSSSTPASAGTTKPVKLDPLRHVLLAGPKGSTGSQVTSAARGLGERIEMYGYEGVTTQVTKINGQTYVVLEADAWTRAMKERIAEMSRLHVRTLTLHESVSLTSTQREQYQPGKRAPSGSKWIKQCHRFFPEKDQPGWSSQTSNYTLISRSTAASIKGRRFYEYSGYRGSEAMYALLLNKPPKNRNQYLYLVIDKDRALRVYPQTVKIRGSEVDALLFSPGSKLSVACIQFKMPISLQIVPFPSTKPTPGPSSAGTNSGPPKVVKPIAIPPQPALTTGIGKKGHESGLLEVRETITALKMAGNHSVATENEAWEAGEAIVQNWHRDIERLVSVGRLNLTREEKAEIATVLAWWRVVASRSRAAR